MEQNKSLSARIKRRNKQGFDGLGSHVNFKEVIYNVKDITLNHKLADRDEEQINLVNFAKKRGYSKHSGSKSISQLRRYI